MQSEVGQSLPLFNAQFSFFEKSSVINFRGVLNTWLYYLVINLSYYWLIK